MICLKHLILYGVIVELLPILITLVKSTAHALVVWSCKMEQKLMPTRRLRFFFGNGVYHTRSDKPLSMEKRYISVTITQEPWVDDMSVEEFPYRVEITENFRHYIGVGLIKE